MDENFEQQRAEWVKETNRQLRILGAKLMANETYGWFDDAIGEPAYDPPYDAPCLYCGLPLTANDVRTHSVMAALVAERSYFYRTHRTCDENATDDQKQAIMGGVLDRIGHDLGIASGEPIV